jgi:hypothetical protein
MKPFLLTLGMNVNAHQHRRREFAMVQSLLRSCSKSRVAKMPWVKSEAMPEILAQYSAITGTKDCEIRFDTVFLILTGGSQPSYGPR